MRVLVACERTGTVRDAFAARGHDAWSCDLAPSSAPGQHIQGSILDVPMEGWDLMIAHPPCTDLAVSGARWMADKGARVQEALLFFQVLLDAPIPRVAIENPISIAATHIRKPNQIIQPWMFGHGETKATCLWLRGLPLLVATDIMPPSLRLNLVHSMPDVKGRSEVRSRTYPGIARAMAEQWGQE